MRRALVLCLLFAGCNDFEGAEGNVGFTSNLRRPYLSWTPGTPLARGSVVGIGASELKHLSANPAVTASLDGGTSVQVLDAGTNWVTLLAAEDGRTRVEWNGNAHDWFEVWVQEPVAATLADPVRDRTARWLATETRFGELNPVELSDLHLVGGEPFFLDTFASGATGDVLAHSPGVVSLVTDGGAPAAELGFGVLFSVPEAGVGDFGGYALALDGGVVHRGRVIGGDVSEAVALELTLWKLSPDVILALATPRLDGGAPLLQAPIVWEVDPGFVRLDTTDAGVIDPKEPRRRDVAGFSWLPTDAGYPPGDRDATVTAVLGGLRQSVTLTMTVQELPDAGEPPDAGVGTEPPTGCGCSAPGSEAPLLLALLLGVAWLGSRRPRARQDVC